MEDIYNNKKDIGEMPTKCSIYRSKDDLSWGNCLSQGDILDPSALRDNLRGHQDYFIKDRFVRYMVLTQTCDLVFKKLEENKKGKKDRLPVDYILIAVVRRMRDVFGWRHVDDSNKKNTTRQELTKILNHQYDKRGLFYLPVKKDHGIEEPCVVDLRVVFSLYNVHYFDLLKARLGGLNDLYAAILGHSLGYMYSRIAVPDMEEELIKKEVDETLNVICEDGERRLNELVKNMHIKNCMISGCEGDCETYRWLKVGKIGDEREFEEYVLCKKHAGMHDRGELIRSDCKIRYDGKENHFFD